MAEEIGDPSIETENPDPESQRPAWLPDKFKSEEDFANSYKELEREFHSTRSALRAQQERFEEFLAEQQTQQVTQQQNSNLDAWDQAIVSAYEEGDFARARTLQRQLEDARAAAVLQAVQQTAPTPTHDSLLAEIAVDQAMTAAHSDWGEYKERALGWVKENAPNYESLAPADRARLAEVGYRYVLADDLPNVLARQQQNDLTQQKIAGQTMSGAGVRQPAVPDEQAAWERIAGAGSGSYESLMSRGR